MKIISSGFNLFLDSSKRLQYNNRIFEAVHAGQAEALCQRENRPLMVVTKQKPELTSGNRKWDISMDKLLKVEIEQEEDEEDDGFAPRKLFLSGNESFKPTPAKDEVQIMEW